MDWERLFGIVVLAVIVWLSILAIKAVSNFEKKRKHKIDEDNVKARAQEVERAKKRKEEKAKLDEEEIREYNERNLRKAFGVELDTIHEQETKNEIIRIMDLLAHMTATACVNQDRAYRGEKPSRDEDEDVTEIKLRWASARKFILEIAPELADRMPHFSEFEPLKTYRAEHLAQKKAKQPA